MTQHRIRKRLLRAGTFVVVGLATLAIAGAANSRPGASSAKPVVFKLKEKHHSQISGTATLTSLGKRVRVVLRLQGGSLDNLPAHIHTGPCRREPTFANPRIWSGLRNVVRGKSTTTIRSTTLKSLRARSYSINVHHPASLEVVACGDIPRG